VVALTEVQFEADPFVCRFRVKSWTLNSDGYRCAVSENSRATKIILYETLIRPVVSYGAEAWTLTKKEEEALLIF